MTQKDAMPEQNFQPQTRDTTNGPNLHAYIPRSDGGITVGGIAYYPVGHAALAIPAVVAPPAGQTYIQQPINCAVPMVAQPQVIYQQPYPGYPQQPPFGTIGLTGSEVLAQQVHRAQVQEMDKAQEMKPCDDDKFRFYWVRELDNTWTQRNRLTIDSGDIGKCRWYAKDGVFYAVRLPSS